MRISPFKISFFIPIAGILCFFSYLIFAPDGSEFKNVSPSKTAVMSSVEEQLDLKQLPIKYKFVPIERISSNLRLAVIVAEDFDFASHNGFALNEIIDSVYKGLRNFRIPRGASTISQQLAKNLYLSNSRNPLRKVREAIITYKLEKTLTKRRILELYLNIVELGPGIFGAEAASFYWFSKPASALNPAESAKLAAILPGPNSFFNPIRHPGRVATRQQILLRRMARAKLPAGL